MIPSQYRRAVYQYKPIETNGIKLFPIEVQEYEEFMTARPVLDFLQQTLPVRHAVMPLLSAFYAIDYESIAQGKESTGIFYRALLLLSLAMRIGRGSPPKERVRRWRPIVDQKDPGKLISLRVTIDGEEQREIPSTAFGEMREIIAMQNGVELISPSANPELVEAEQEMNATKNRDLIIDPYLSMISVAVLSGKEETEMATWPILKLKLRQEAIERAMNYIVCGISESVGSKWKGGNPVPHPIYERKKQESGGVLSLHEFAGGAAEKAVLQSDA